MEKDDEYTSGSSNVYSTYYREYDARLGRWFGKDPITIPFESPYAAMGNNPIAFSDPIGDKIKYGSFKDWARTQYKRLTDKKFRTEFKKLKSDYKEKVKDSKGNDTKQEKVLRIETNGKRSNHTLDEAVENHETTAGSSNKRGEVDYLYYNGNVDKITVTEQEHGSEYVDGSVTTTDRKSFKFDLTFHGNKDNFDHWQIKTLDMLNVIPPSPQIIDRTLPNAQLHFTLINSKPNQQGGDGDPGTNRPATYSLDHADGGWGNGWAQFQVEAFGVPRIYSIERKLFGIWDYRTKKDLSGFKGKTDKRYYNEVKVSITPR